MKNNRQAFTIYLSFLSMALAFMLLMSSASSSIPAMDMARSDLLETIGFHAASGGLEKAKSLLNSSEQDIQKIDYEFSLKPFRKVRVQVTSNLNNGVTTLTSIAHVYEGNQQVSQKTLKADLITTLSGFQCSNIEESP
ncbi:MAG: hypothetical protein GX221_00585 [Candidatus Riflebacteria bacterium]|nr:hypothetical protein [Candidatus Riflebacteria bacterium]